MFDDQLPPSNALTIATPVIDLHEDVSTYNMTESNPENDFSKDVSGRQADFPKYQRAGTTVIVASIFSLIRTWNPKLSNHLGAGYGDSSPALIPRSPTANALEQFKVYYQMSRTFSDFFQIIWTRNDLEDSVKSRRLAFIICLEGAEALEDVSDLEIFYRLGLRAVGLTWNFDTRYASACMSKKDYGLTGEGEQLVEEANDRGVIVDLAHSSKATMLDALALSRRPVMISHANYAGIRPHARNVDDQVLEALVRNGGVVGFTMINETIGPKPSVESLAEHIIAVRNRFGSDLLAIGTDYLGMSTTPAGLEDITKLSDLFARLSALGMSKDEIANLAWKNAYRVFERNAETWR